MANGIRTGDPRGFNKGRSSKFREGSRVRQTPEEGRRTYRPKRCGNNNKDEDNSPKNLNDKSSLNLSIFFLFSFVEGYQFSFNFEFSVRLSFSRVYGLNFIFQLVLIESIGSTFL